MMCEILFNIIQVCATTCFLVHFNDPSTHVFVYFNFQAAEHTARNFAAMSRSMEVDLRISNPAHTLQRIRAMESPSPAHVKASTTENTPNPLLVIYFQMFWLNLLRFNNFVNIAE